MTVENFAIQQIKALVPNCDELEIELYIDDLSYSVDFSVLIDRQRKQCLDLIDDGVFTNKEYEKAAEKIADYTRSSVNYKKGCVNKFKTTYPEKNPAQAQVKHIQ